MYNTLFLKEKNYVLVALEDNLELNFFLALLKMHCLALYRSSMYAIGYYPGNSVIEEHMHSLRHAVYIAARSNLFERSWGSVRKDDFPESVVLVVAGVLRRY